MKPSRLETTCKVTLRRFAFPALRDIVPPRGDSALFWNPSNRQSVLHSMLQGEGRASFSEQPGAGWPILSRLWRKSLPRAQSKEPALSAVEGVGFPTADAM